MEWHIAQLTNLKMMNGKETHPGVAVIHKMRIDYFFSHFVTYHILFVKMHRVHTMKWTHSACFRGRHHVLWCTPPAWGFIQGSQKKPNSQQTRKRSEADAMPFDLLHRMFFCSFTEVRRGRILIKQGQGWLMKIYVAQVCRPLALKTNAALWWTAEDRHYWHSMITYKGNLILVLLGYEVLTSYILGHDIMWLPFWTIPREF